VDRLDAGFEHLRLRLKLVKGRSLAVDRPALSDFDLLAGLGVEDFTDDVEDLALGDVANGDRDGLTGVADFLSTNHAVGGLEGDRANEVISEVLRNLKSDLGRLVADHN